MIFKPGDLVTYQAKSPSIERWDGSDGIFVKYDTELQYSSDWQKCCFVQWVSGEIVKDQEKSRFHDMYPVWTRHISSGEKPYDPTQQGDQEDDI